MADTITARLRAIASGDTEAFGRFYDEWFDAMYADARTLTRRDEAFCMDVVHDAMLRVIRGIPPLHSDAALRLWLRRVIASSAYDRLRRDRRRARREQVAMRLKPIDPGPADDELNWIRRELDRLDGAARDLIEMRYRFGWTLERIGRRLGISASAVDGRLRRTIVMLHLNAREKFDE